MLEWNKEGLTLFPSFPHFSQYPSDTCYNIWISTILKESFVLLNGSKYRPELRQVEISKWRLIYTIYVLTIQVRAIISLKNVLHFAESFVNMEMWCKTDVPFASAIVSLLRLLSQSPGWRSYFMTLTIYFTIKPHAVVFSLRRILWVQTT